MTLRSATGHSPIGPYLVTGAGNAVTSVTFGVARAADAEPHRALDDAVRQLDEYFAGTRRSFDLELDPAGTPFEQIPDTWFCPVCGARKRDFVLYED